MGVRALEGCLGTWASRPSFLGRCGSDGAMLQTKLGSCRDLYPLPCLCVRGRCCCLGPDATLEAHAGCEGMQ